MGSRPFGRLSALTLIGVSALLKGLATEATAGIWGACLQREGLCDYFLNVATRQGQARFTVDDRCLGTWRHAWRRADAKQTIEQWIKERAASGSGGLCIPLAGEVDEIRVTLLGGHCGYADNEVNTPDRGLTLRRGHHSATGGTLSGCHARIGDFAFGGVALDFADGYGFGDSYAAGHFYGVYDSYGRGGVRPTGASVWQISQYNTYHYRVEILAGGSTAWHADFQENDR